MTTGNLCTVCKTGRVQYELDPRAPFCPYICMNDGSQCVMFVQDDDCGEEENEDLTSEAGKH